MALKRTGPVALTAVTTTNIYNPPGPEEVRNLHIANKTDNAVTFSLWLGATAANAAGTELFSQVSIPARGIFDWPYPIKMGTADFLVGGASTAAALTLTLSTIQVAA